MSGMVENDSMLVRKVLFRRLKIFNMKSCVSRKHVCIEVSLITVNPFESHENTNIIIKLSKIYTHIGFYTPSNIIHII